MWPSLLPCNWTRCSSSWWSLTCIELTETHCSIFKSPSPQHFILLWSLLLPPLHTHLWVAILPTACILFIRICKKENLVKKSRFEHIWSLLKNKQSLTGVISAHFPSTPIQSNQKKFLLVVRSNTCDPFRALWLGIQALCACGISHHLEMYWIVQWERLWPETREWRW